MNLIKRATLILLLSTFSFSHVWAGTYEETIDIFRNAGESAGFFNTSYGYAVFPTITKVGVVIGGAGGDGRVYVADKYVGDTQSAQMSVGLQFGAQGFSQIVFFQDKTAFDTFTSGKFKFGVQASAVAITAGATASSGTGGNTESSSGNKNNAKTKGEWVQGMAIFTVIKGGLMYETALAGQTFTYTPLKPK